MIPYMYTFTGKRVNPLDVQGEDIDIRDISHHLSLINRFNGASNKPISVAQHSIFVSRLCRKFGVKHELQALFHDASETYLGDITKWLKQSDAFKEYRRIEKVIQDRVFIAFGCDINTYTEVEKADRLMVRFEMHKECVKPEILEPGTNKVHPSYPPITKTEINRIGKWQPWDWVESEELFHITYNSIMERMNDH